MPTKQINILVTADEHAEYLMNKGDRTWQEVLEDGLEAGGGE